MAIKVAVVLPGPSRRPIGGYKIIYEYIKRLANFGYNFDIFYPLALLSTSKKKLRFQRELMKFGIYNQLCPFWKWFNFDRSIHRIRHIVRPRLSFLDLENYNIIIVSSVETAYLVNNLKLNKPVLYMIQHFENWNMSDDNVIASYKFERFYNVVVSKWLMNILRENNAPIFLYLPDPIDHSIFRMEIKPEDRMVKSIAMMYDRRKWKGSDKGIISLNLLKQEHLNLQVSLFGVDARPKFIPMWMKYYKTPPLTKLVEIYNQNAIFLSTSEKEGFGLPPAEAMACGSCVVTADSGGVLDFCLNGKTSIIVPSNNPENFVKAVNDLFTNDKKRISIAYNGHNYIKKFNWNKNIAKINHALKYLISPA